MERFQQLFNMQGRGQGGGAPDAPLVDTAEKLHISSLALLKMLKHGEAHVPGGAAHVLGDPATEVSLLLLFLLLRFGSVVVASRPMHSLLLCEFAHDKCRARLG